MTAIPAQLNQSQHFHQCKGTPFGRLLRAMLIVCQVLCVAPILPEQHNAYICRRIHHFWSLALLIHIYIVNFLQAQESVSEHLNVTTVERGLYLSEFVTNTMIVTFAISSCHYFLEYYTSVPRKLLHIYQGLQRYQVELEYKDTLFYLLQKELQHLLCWAVGFLLICFVIDFIFSDYEVLLSLRSSSAYNIPNTLMSLNLGQYWLALRFICHLYRRLNDIVQRHLHATKHSNLAADAGTDPMEFWQPDTYNWYKSEFTQHSLDAQHASPLDEHEFLEYMRSLYAELDHLLTKLVQTFELLILLHFFASFLDLAVQNFAVYKFMDNPSINVIGLIYKVLWIVLHTGRYFFVLLPSNAIIREKRRTCFILNDLEPSSRQLEHAINRFLLQLMVRKAETACGIISLDLMFLGGLMSALATYIIFLIQIDLGNESLVGTIPNKTTRLYS